MALTDAGRRVLARMAAGEAIVHNLERGEWHLDPFEPGAKTPMINQFLDKGFIRLKSRQWPYDFYSITATGRAALEQE